jgi:hypothetical protein
LASVTADIMQQAVECHRASCAAAMLFESKDSMLFILLITSIMQQVVVDSLSQVACICYAYCLEMKIWEVQYDAAELLLPEKPFVRHVSLSLPADT